MNTTPRPLRTRLPSFNAAAGIDGLPCGAIVELMGPGALPIARHIAAKNLVGWLHDKPMDVRTATFVPSSPLDDDQDRAARQVESALRTSGLPLIVLDAASRFEPAVFSQQVLRGAAEILSVTQSTMLLVNTARVDSPATRYYAGLRIDTRHTPNGLEVRVLKNKFSCPFRTGVVTGLAS